MPPGPYARLLAVSADTFRGYAPGSLIGEHWLRQRKAGIRRVLVNQVSEIDEDIADMSGAAVDHEIVDLSEQFSAALRTSAPRISST
jgi:hypothetical protein